MDLRSKKMTYKFHPFSCNDMKKGKGIPESNRTIHIPCPLEWQMTFRPHSSTL